jgi:hypothetical protein
VTLSRSLSAAILALSTLLTGCATATVPVTERCDIDILELSSTEVAPGESLVVTGRPLTTTYDTAAYIAGQRATVLELSRTECDACDICRSRSGCTACDDCDDCATECTVDCVETLTVEVPAAPAGPTDLRVYNAHGESRPAELQVSGPADSGSPDSGSPDSGSPDSGSPDSGSPDSGAR